MSETSKQIVANRALPYSLLPQLSSEYQHANQHAVERQLRVAKKITQFLRTEVGRLSKFISI